MIQAPAEFVAMRKHKNRCDACGMRVRVGDRLVAWVAKDGEFGRPLRTKIHRSCDIVGYKLDVWREDFLPRHWLRQDRDEMLMALKALRASRQA